MIMGGGALCLGHGGVPNDEDIMERERKRVQERMKACGMLMGGLKKILSWLILVRLLHLC